MVGVVVKVTASPAQIVELLAAMLTDGVTEVLTLIVMLFDDAVVVDAHVALEVSTQLTTASFANELLVKTGLFVPTLLPFTFHW